MGEFVSKAGTMGWPSISDPFFKAPGVPQRRCQPDHVPCLPQCSGLAVGLHCRSCRPRRRSRPLALNLLSSGWSEGLSGAEPQLCKRQHVIHCPCPCAGQNGDGWRLGPVPGTDISWQEVSPPTWAGATSSQRQGSAPARQGCPRPRGVPRGARGNWGPWAAQA